MTPAAAIAELNRFVALQLRAVMRALGLNPDAPAAVSNFPHEPADNA